MVFLKMKLLCVGILLNYILVSNGNKKTQGKCSNIGEKYRTVPACYDYDFIKSEGKKLAEMFVKKSTDKTKVYLTGYVPNREVIKKSGVKIGAGIDLGNIKTELSSDLKGKLNRYLGKTGISAEQALTKSPLELEDAEVNKLDEIAINEVIHEIKNNLRGSTVNLQSFTSAQTTAIISLTFEPGKNQSEISSFWNLLKSNDLQKWDKIVNLLRNFYNDDTYPLNQRRLDEANLLEKNNLPPCCPGLLYEGQCYFVVHEKLDYENARYHCQSKKGDLAVLEYKNIIQALHSDISKSTGQMSLVVSPVGTTTELIEFESSQDVYYLLPGLPATISENSIPITTAPNTARLFKSTDGRHDIFTETREDRLWIGAADCTNKINQTHTFTWVDGQNVKHSTYTKLWMNGGPKSTTKDCATFVPDINVDNVTDIGSIREDNCDFKFKFICEVSMQGSTDVQDDTEKVDKLKKKLNKKTEDRPINKILDINKKRGNSSKLVDGDIKKRPNAEDTVSEYFGIPPAHAGTGRKRKRQKRNVIGEVYWYWLYDMGQSGPDIFVFYDYDENAYSFQEKENITRALSLMGSRTCIEFLRLGDYSELYNSIGYHMYFTRDPTGCWSYIGRAADSGPLPINLDIGCTDLYIVMHELMHALGVWHEHSRPDRDDYITINFDNIYPGMEHNFDKIVPPQVEVIAGYDYNSIMHYNSNAYSMTGLPTIEINRDVQVDIGNRAYITETDIAEINYLYLCNIPTHGGWSYWNSWTECSTTCGEGSRTRTRKCDLPRPRNEGKYCENNDSETEPCSTDPCPDTTILYRWYGCWDDPRLPSRMISIESQGSLTDNPKLRGNETVLRCAKEAKQQGFQIFGLRDGYCHVLSKNHSATPEEYLFLEASHSCTAEKHGSVDAIDAYILGNDSIKAYYGPWGEYSSCSKSCTPKNGTSGTKTHHRKCNNPPTAYMFDEGCDKFIESETIPCNTNSCPIDGQWSAWTHWSSCSVSCESGVRFRNRRCDNPPPDGGELCPGYVSEVDVQNETCTTNKYCPLRTDCPSVKVQDWAANLTGYTFIDFDETCAEHGSIPGNDMLLLRVESLKEGPTALTTYGRQGNALMLDENHSFEGVLPGSKACIQQPESCPHGFSISFWIKPSEQGLVQNHDHRPQVIFSTGVQADETNNDQEGQGVAIYISTHGALKAIVKTTGSLWLTDLPTRLVTSVQFFHVALTFSISKGLSLFHAGKVYDNDNDGDRINGSYLKTYQRFSLGKAIDCDADNYIGDIDELFILDKYLDAAQIDDLYMSVPMRCGDCDPSANCINGTCVCKETYTGNGWHCQRKVNDIDIKRSSLGTPLLFWPMSNPDDVNNNIIPASSDPEPTSQIPLRHDKTNIKESFRENNDNSFSLNFNGRDDGAVSDDIDHECVASPDLCKNGITVAFYMTYHGKSNSLNFIFSTGALPWSGYGQTGIYMTVENKVANVCVQTKSKKYSASFQVRHDYRVFYAISFSSQGMTVYEDGKKTTGDAIGISQPADVTKTSILVIGRSSQVSGFHGYFDMDNLIFYAMALNNTQVEDLFVLGAGKLS